MNSLRLEGVRYTETIKPLDYQRVLDTPAGKDKLAINNIEFNEVDLAMVEEASLKMQQSADVDMERVNAMKARIANGDVSFDMSALARALVRS